MSLKIITLLTEVGIKIYIIHGINILGGIRLLKEVEEGLSWRNKILDFKDADDVMDTKIEIVGYKALVGRNYNITTSVIPNHVYC